MGLANGCWSGLGGLSRLEEGGDGDRVVSRED